MRTRLDFARSSVVALCAGSLLALGCTSEPAVETDSAGSGDAGGGSELTTITCLTPDHITECLRSTDQHFPSRLVSAPEYTSELRRAASPLEIEYTFDGASHTLDDFPERTRTTGLIVLRGSEILHEAYFRGADENSRFLSMSVAKSFTSTLLGIARAEGLIESFDDPVTKYLPDLVGTGYDGVAIVDLLQMSSGIGFTEVYADENSDIARLGAACFGGPERLDELARSYPSKREPGIKFEYASLDTAILGRLLRTVTGQNMAAYTERALWNPMGAEADASWIVDLPLEIYEAQLEAGAGTDQLVAPPVECALGGFNATLRDYARFGLLMANDGFVEGERVLPEGWVEEATVPSQDHVQPGNLMAGYKLGYQYQWWTFPDADHSFVAEGIHGQLIMVNPELDLVVVKTSDWEEAWDGVMEAETWALFDALAASVAPSDG